jgi:hypothetical protein
MPVMVNIVFVGLIAHFGFNTGNTAVVVKEDKHVPIIAVTDAQGNWQSFLTKCRSTGSTPPITMICALEGQHIRIVLPSGKPRHHATFDNSVPHLSDVTGGNTPMSEVVSGSSSTHIAALVDYSGGSAQDAELSAECFFEAGEQVLKLGSKTSRPFCPAKYTRFQMPTNDARITIENVRNQKQFFTVPANSTIFIENTSSMKDGFSEYRWMIDNDKGIAIFTSTSKKCTPFDCKVPPIPGDRIRSVSIECVNTQWP